MKTLEATLSVLRSAGCFPEETIHRIEESAQELRKTAESTSFFKNPALQSAVIATAGVGAMTTLATWLLARKQAAKETKGLDRSYAVLKETPNFKKNPAMYALRFHELALVAPVMASNPSFADKAISENLGGFNIHSLNQLAAIEANAGNRSSMRSPGHRVLEHVYGHVVSSAPSLVAAMQSGTPADTRESDIIQAVQQAASIQGSNRAMPTGDTK